MEKYQRTLLLGLLMLIVTYVYYSKNKNEYFEDKHIPECHNPQFELKGTGDDMEYCSKIDNISHGCQKFDKGLNRNPLLAAFSIFGSYIDNLDKKDITPCVNDQSKTLSEWGLCDANFLKEIKGFGYDENKPRIDAIENACKFYENGFKSEESKIQN
jgi:hypothetical protein